MVIFDPGNKLTIMIVDAGTGKILNSYHNEGYLFGAYTNLGSMSLFDDDFSIYTSFINLDYCYLVKF